MDDMTMTDLLDELQALVDKYSADDAEPTETDAERMSALTAEVERRNAAAADARKATAAKVAAARSAIECGSARRVDSVPVARSANAGGIAGIYDRTDYAAAARRAWVKNVAERSGVRLVEGTALTDAERSAMNRTMEQRAAFSHLTTNTDSVIPVEVKNEIVSLIDNTAVLFGDITKYNFPNQFEIPRHKAIAKGDAAATAEGAAPTDDEQNEFDVMTLTGEEIKKTVKMSRKMAVQSIDSFEQYVINETAARLSVAANGLVHSRLLDKTLGMDTANQITTAKANTMTKADVTKMLSLIYSYGNMAPKGVTIYANNNTIWNYIAMIEDANGRSYFVDEKLEDPAVEGHIFGKLVKRDDSIADGIVRAGYSDLIRGNIFDGADVMPYIAQDGSQQRCFDGYLLFDCGLVVPKAFAQLTVKTA